MKAIPVSLTMMFSSLTLHGTIMLPDFETRWDRGDGPGQSQVTSMDEFQIDLDNRIGLTPGLPVRITVSSSENFMWLGGFHMGDYLDSISSEATLSLIVGDQVVSVSSSFSETFGFAVPATPAATSDPVGYITGPALPDFSMVVSWDTDLTDAKFVLAQNSEIAGTGAYFHYSAAYVSSGAANTTSVLSVRLESVPEPGQTFLLTLGSLVLLARRQ